MTAPEPLRALIVEDSVDDVELMIREVRTAGFAVSAVRVETAEAMGRALDEETWDVVIADYALPSFSGLAALKIVQERGLDLPFIVVSGAISDATAVAAMKSGAHDYVLKDNLTRLGPAILRERREAQLRVERRRVGEELAELRERSATELRRSRDQLDVVLRGVAEGVIAVTPTGQISYVNDVAASVLGFVNAAELLSSKFVSFEADFESWDEEDRQLTPGELPVKVALATGQPVERVIRSRHKSGGEDRWHIVTATPIMNDRGEPTMAVIIFRDITERKRAEVWTRFLGDASQALAASLDFSSTLTTLARLAVPRLGDWCFVQVVESPEMTHVAVAPVDTRLSDAGRELLCDPSRLFHRTFGIDEVWASKKPELRSFVNDAPMTSGTERARQLLKDLAPASSLTVPLAMLGAGEATITVVSSHPSRRYGLEDVAPLEELARRAALALENARRYSGAQAAIAARDDFLYIASHELRTPLTALGLQLDRLGRLIQSEAAPTGTARATVERATRQTRRLSRLIESLLDVSRIAIGPLEIDPQEIDLSETVQQVVESLKEEAMASQCDVRSSLEAGVIVFWDRLRTEQIVTNLLSNALKYGAGKPVNIGMTAAENSVRLTIADQGIGIAAKDKARIFQRFERAVTSRNYGGLGLGLFIVQQIVDAHGGRIEVESEPGVGSTFSVFLPRRARVSAARHPAEATA